MDFTWDSMAGKLQDNAFNDKKQYDDADSRFWKLSRDEDGNGGAIIRFLPDPNNLPFVKMIKINARTSQKGYFVNDWSPQSIGLKCPFNDEFSMLWKRNEGNDRDVAKTLGRQFRFITNIKIIKDPANPENEGKIFLYEMSSSTMDSIKEVMVQTEAMKALEEEPIAVFNPLEGNSFLIKIKNGDNNIPTYSSSKFADKVNSIYDSMEQAEADITTNAFALSEFLAPEKFLSFEELSEKLDKFLKRGKFAPGAKEDSEAKAIEQAQVNTGLSLGTEGAKAEPQAEPQAQQTVQTGATASETDNEIDDLLADIA